MTTWTTIPDASLDPGKPARSIDAKALRDNPIAIAEGATGAPKVRTAGLQPPAAGATYLIANVQDAATGTSSTAYVTSGFSRYYLPTSQIGFIALVPGVVRVSFSHRSSNAAATSFARVIKNGVLVQEWSTTSTTDVARTVDVTVATGDDVIVQHRTSNGTYSSVYSLIRVYSDTPDFAVA